MVIKDITARKIIASAGDFTLEAKITFEDGSETFASVPAGISAGKYEIKKSEPDKALEEIEGIKEILKNKDWAQETLDKEISSHDFGGNSTLAVSAAFFKSGMLKQVQHDNQKFPKLMLLLFEGGEHGNKNITIQEFLGIEDSLEQAMRDFRTLKEYLEEQNVERTVGAEGAYSPEKFTNEKVLETIRKVFPTKQIGVDMAECFGESNIPDGVFSVEDPYDDESWEKWTNLTSRHSYLVIADDLTTTNPERIKKAIEARACDAVVIKPNQIGTISGAKEAVKVAREGGLKIIVSHRGQETDDIWIVDFALSVEADYVKFGGMDRGERIAKYNRLIELGMK